MDRALLAVLALALMTAAWTTPLYAQEESEKINSNLGFSIATPLNPTAQFTSPGWGFTAGAGYNFSQHHSIIGEVMWDRLYATDNAIGAIRAVVPQSSGLSGHNSIFAVTANYRFELRGKSRGVYFIGGGGWYYRSASLSREVTTGTTTTCTPEFLWWGFSCESGVVTSNQTLASTHSSALGANGGVGFTVKVGEPSYRFYVESRYHYAPNKRFSTQLVNITVGIRY
jgi:hypothetical protein